MEFYTLLQILIIIGTSVGVDIPRLFSESTLPSTTKSSELAFVFGDGKGNTRKIQIDPTDIPQANLSVLTDWLYWTDELKTFLDELKRKDNCEVRCMVPSGADGVLKTDDVPVPLRIDQSIKMIEEFQRKMETELRKPEKEWNYPVEENVPAITQQSNATAGGAGHIHFLT